MSAFPILEFNIYKLKVKIRQTDIYYIYFHKKIKTEIKNITYILHILFCFGYTKNRAFGRPLLICVRLCFYLFCTKLFYSYFSFYK